MLGNGAPRIGPSATNSAAGSTSTNDLNSQHQAQFNRGIWPAGTTTFQTNGITVPITDSTSIFAPGFTQTAAAASSSPFIPTLPFEFVKNWNTGVGFSQANSSIFVQSHTATAAADFLNCTTSAASATITTAPSSIKKSVDIGKWEAAASLIEPLQIHLPVTSFNTTTAPAIKSENISSGSSSSSTSSKTPTSSCNSSGSGYKKNSSKSSKGIKNINDCILNLHQHHQNKSNEGTKLEISGTGCSRTLPIAWNSNLHTDGTGTTGTLLQIKREPCQVSEVTTSNNLLATTSFSAGTPTIIKIEQKSPTSTSQSNIASITSSSVNMDSGNNNSGHIGATTSQAIPIGIAVGRQRLQETTTTSQTTSASHLQAKDLNRFGLGLDLGCAATPNLSQNMFFTGTTIPLTDVMHQNHQSVAMNRTPPTLFQYPTMPMEIPTTLPPPVGFQLVRDPSTGQFLFLPAATTIVTLDKINISCIEPIPQALVWPTFPQATASTTAGLQPPHLLLPPLQQSLQPPPPLALLGSDYLTASTTLHQSHLQHTSTHSTRLVALTSDTSKRTKTQQTTTTVPLPLPAAHALIKIEDGGHHHHQPTATTAAIFEQEKSIQTASIATAVQTPTEISGQLFYQHPGLIQIAPQSQPTVTVPTSAITMESTECRHLSSPPPLQLTAAAQAAIAAHSANASISDTQLSHIVQQQHQPEVQDANIQTSPIMSEDDNSSGHDGVMVETNVAEFCDEESQEHNEKPIVKLNEPEVTREEIAEHRESVPDTSVTSSSLIVNIKQQIESPDTSEMISKDNDAEPSQSQQLEEQREPVDLSGLQLLSNSIDVFQKKIIKQEPNDQLQITSPTIASTTITPPISEIAARIEEKPLVEIPKGIPEDLGGLNLLCALAEQRLEEDFQSSGNTPPSPSTEEIEMNLATNSSIKKRKHKVKSSKKKHKEEKKAKKRKHSEDDDELKDEMAASLKRVKTKFDNLPITSVDDVFRLMENDMKEKLANITRQCEEKRRELKQIKSTDGNEKTDSNNEQQQTTTNSAIKPAKVSYSSNTSTPLKFSIIPALSPSFSSSSNSESLVDIPKLSSDTDSGSKDDGSERSKRKFSIPNKNHGDKQGTETIVAKKSKSFVDYILASKQKLLQVTSTQVSSTLTTNSPTIDSWTSSIKNGKASLPFVKQEDQDGRGILKESAFKDERVFSIFGDGNSQKFQASSPLTLPSVSRPQQSFVKHHSSKHKKHKERKRHRDRQRLDSRVKINAEHLKQAKTRVLMAQGGLFYAGTLTPVEPLEVYAITLDGERGNRPHIMPREEILKQAILEIQPKTTAECPPGTRLCAYWSQQYRCLYPGVATIPSSPDSDVDEKYVNVEFDDGDSGRIVLEHIRFLFSDYPIVEYDPNPLQSLNKRKRQSSHAPSSDHDQKITQQSTNEVSLSREERKRLKKIRKEKNRLQSSPDHAQDSFVVEHKKKKKHKCHDDDLCKHRKHKKRRKKNHKKHHHRELEEEDRELQHHVQSAMLISSNDSNNNEEEFDEESSLNESVAQYEIVKKVDQEALIKDDPDTMESSPSTVTESSGSLYTPKKSTSTEKLNRSNESGSKIAAFLPARQLWAWSGKGFKRSTGRVKKQFYRSIQRGKETISVGDSAVFLSTGRPDRPYIGHIESMWETANGHMVVRVKWFYHPEETQGCPNLKYPGALFESPHEDENDVQTISHKCEVLPLEAYVNKFGDDPKQYESIYDNNDTYYLAGSYDPTLYHIKMQQEIPVLHENEKWI